MSTSSSGSGSTNHITNPTTAKHQLVSPEGFLRPVEVPQGVTKLVIYVGGDGGRDTKEKLEAILRVCEGINGVRACIDLSTLRSMIEVSSQRVKYLVFNYRKGRAFTLIATDRTYRKSIQEGKCYEVSYELFIEKLRWARRALLFQDYVEKMGGD